MNRTWRTDWNAFIFFRERTNTMNIIYAECDIHHNSIYIAAIARYLFRIDCWEAEKGINDYSLFGMCLKCSCDWWATWICPSLSWWQYADVDKYREFFRHLEIFSQNREQLQNTMVLFSIVISQYKKIFPHKLYLEIFIILFFIFSTLMIYIKVLMPILPIHHIYQSWLLHKGYCKQKIGRWPINMCLPSYMNALSVAKKHTSRNI